MGLTVRRLGPDDAPAYRALRLYALKDAPKAFGEALEEAQKRPAGDWQALFLGERAFFAVFEDGALVGSANVEREQGLKQHHRGWLYGVYVMPGARGGGASDLLLNAALAHAKAAGMIQLHLGVGTYNRPAQRLYERFGFTVYGTQPRALLVDGNFIDEHHMVCFLDKEDS